MIGTLALGKKSGFVVIDGNPHLSDPYAMHRIEINLTVSNGPLAYDKNDQ